MGQFRRPGGDNDTNFSRSVSRPGNSQPSRISRPVGGNPPRNSRPVGRADEQPRPLVSPSNMVPVEVIRREVVAPQVVTLHLVIPGTQQPPAPYLPGQFVTLALPTQNETLYRSYSLCGAGIPDRPWEITIKRVRQGAVSTYLYEMVDEGTLLYASFPRGAFTLPAHVGRDTPLVFIAAGSGITPIIGMLRAIARMPARQRPPVQLHFASRDVRSIIYREELAEMDPNRQWLRQWHYLSSEGQRLTAAAVIHQVGRNLHKARWYMCGPEDLKEDIAAVLQRNGVPEEQILFEVFATQRGASRVNFQIVDADDTTSTSFIRVQATDAVLGVQANETVLAALERHEYKPEFSCRSGTCGVCKLKLLSGTVNPARGPGLSAREAAAGYILSCIAYPQGDIVLESAGRPPARQGGANVPAPTGARRTLITSALRIGTVAATIGLVAGAWNLTNHRPASWQASAQAPQSMTPSPTKKPGKHHATPTPSASGGSPTPTTVASGGNPTPTPVASGGGNPTPTMVVSGNPTATPTQPPPAPTATSTPSVAH